MPEAFSTPNLVALPITSQELGRGGGGFCPPTKIVLPNSPTTIGLKSVELMLVEVSNKICLIKDLIGFAGAKWVGWG